MSNIAEITNEILENLARENEINNMLFQLSDNNQVDDIVYMRSKELRSLYAKNETLYQKIRKCLRYPLDAKMADDFFEATRTFILNGCEDREIICELSHPLIEYYKGQGNVERAINAAVFYCVNYYEHFVRMNPQAKNREFVCETLRWVVSNRILYKNFKDYRAQANVFNAYKQLIIMEIAAAREKHQRIQSLDLIHQVLDFWNSDDIKAATLEYDYVKNIVDDIKTSVLMEMEVEEDVDSKILDAYLNLMQDFYQDNKATKEWYCQTVLKHIEIRTDLATEKISEEEAYKKYQDIILNLPKIDWAQSEVNAQDVITIYVFVFCFMVKRLNAMCLSIEVREESIIELLEVLGELTAGMPYQYQTTYINDVYRHLFGIIVSKINSFEKFEYLMDKLMISRQPFTYLHAELVAIIANMIAEELVQTSPEIFMTMPEFEKLQVSEVQEHADLLHELIDHSARMHDLGKCDVALLVTKKSRKITDDEFECIKNHPTIGADYLERVSDVVKNSPMHQVCLDVMLGHHKFYDGKNGYPANYDNTKSRYRVIVDLITIADSIDAATDALGRNYAKEKKFPMVLEELKAQSGTRYNPKIVDAIVNSQQLIKQLMQITEQERTQYIYEAYSNAFFQLHNS